MSNLFKINASAGSGKTYALTRRYLKLLANSSLHITPISILQKQAKTNQVRYNFSEVLAITFTNLAATQMQARIISSLKNIALGDNKDKDDWRQKDAVQALDLIFRRYSALNIRTIDSLLHHLVRLGALEFGLSPKFDVTFDTKCLMQPIFDRLAKSALHQEEEAELFRQVCAVVLNYGSKKRFIAGEKVKEDCIGIAESFIKAQIPFTDDYFSSDKELENYLNRINSLDIQGLARNLQDILEEEELQSTAYLNKALVNLIENGSIRSEMFYKENLDACLKKASKGQASSYAQELYLKLQSFALIQRDVASVLRRGLIFQPMARLAQRLEAEAWDEEREQSLVLSDRMPILSAAMLRGNFCVNDAFCRLGSRLHHILLDEFQDTSLQQWLALEPLAEESMSQGGSVYFVGDVKQAIYGWRGGEAQLFDDAPNSLLSLAEGYEESPLLYNWRSHASVIAWNNTFFEKLLDANALRNALPFLLSKTILKTVSNNIALQEEIEQTVTKVQNVYKTAEQLLPESKAEQESTAFVQVHRVHLPPKRYNLGVLSLIVPSVLELRKRYEWEDICILVITNKQAAQVAEVLLAHDIPVVSEGSLLLADYPIIAELISLIRFLANPLDERAFWHVLNAEYILPFSLDKKELWEFISAKRKESLSLSFQKQYPYVWEAFFRPITDGAGLMTTYDTLCDIFERWQIKESHPETQVYLLRLLEIVFLAEADGSVDLTSFLAWWDSKGLTEKAPLPEHSKAVSIMTVHKSKGLEFEAVIMPWLDFKIDTDSKAQTIFYDALLPNENGELEQEQLTLLSPLAKEHGRPYYQALFAKSLECINALYVAWTRAVQELHIFMPEEKNEKFPTFVRSLLQSISAEENPCLTRMQDYYEFSLNASVENPRLFSSLYLRTLEFFLCAEQTEFKERFLTACEFLQNNVDSEVLQAARLNVEEGLDRDGDYQEDEDNGGDSGNSRDSDDFDDNGDNGEMKLSLKELVYTVKNIYATASKLENSLPHSHKHSQDERQNLEENEVSSTFQNLGKNQSSKPSQYLEERQNIGDVQGLETGRALGKNQALDLDNNSSDELFEGNKERIETEERACNEGENLSRKLSNPQDWQGEKPSRERPIAWLPRIKIFRSNLEDIRAGQELSANKRGILMHKCLEYLILSSDSPTVRAHNVERAVQRAFQELSFTYVPQAKEQDFYQALEWFASCDSPYGGAYTWLNNGLREHALTSGEGKLYRVDLLVTLPKDSYVKKLSEHDVELVAIDYKTGYDGEIPDKNNIRQMQNYLELLKEASQKEVRGLLVYLDRQAIYEVE